MNVKFSEVKVGDLVEVIGFDCMKGKVVISQNERGELFVPCSSGRHYLSGQLDEDNDTLVGIFKA